MSETSNNKCDYTKFTKEEYNQWIKDGQRLVYWSEDKYTPQ